VRGTSTHTHARAHTTRTSLHSVTRARITARCSPEKSDWRLAAVLHTARTDGACGLAAASTTRVTAKSLCQLLQRHTNAHHRHTQCNPQTKQFHSVRGGFPCAKQTSLVAYVAVSSASSESKKARNSRPRVMCCSVGFTSAAVGLQRLSATGRRSSCTTDGIALSKHKHTARVRGCAHRPRPLQHHQSAATRTA